MAELADDIIIATTVNAADDPIAALAKHECKCFRGSEEDVLSRYHDAAMAFGLDNIVRVTSDCPCIDPHIVDSTIRKHLGSGFACTSNVGARTFARGMDVEVFTMDALVDAHSNAKEQYQREHVTPYIHEHNRTQNLTAAELYGTQRFTRPDLRITVDTPLDYALACCIYDGMQGKFDSTFKNRFTYEDVVALFEKKPWLAMINADVAQKPTK
jgi:spore coat polysaccharide biosynthesis protein SpsF